MGTEGLFCKKEVKQINATDWKERNKTTSICRGHDVVHIKSKVHTHMHTQNLLEPENKFSKGVR